MAKVTIEGVDYDTDTMSQESRQQLEMLMMTEQRIRQMQAELAMMQTARQAYAAALKASLVATPTPESGETFKFWGAFRFEGSWKSWNRCPDPRGITVQLGVEYAV